MYSTFPGKNNKRRLPQYRVGYDHPTPRSIAPPTHHDGEENSPTAQHLFPFLSHFICVPPLPALSETNQKVKKPRYSFHVQKVTNVLLRRRRNPPPPPCPLPKMFKANKERKFETAHCLVQCSVKEEARGGAPNTKEEIDTIYPAMFRVTKEKKEKKRRNTEVPYKRYTQTYTPFSNIHKLFLYGDMIINSLP